MATLSLSYNHIVSVGVRRAACSVRRAACSVRRAACGVRRAACSVRRAACGVRLLAAEWARRVGARRVQTPRRQLHAPPVRRTPRNRRFCRTPNTPGR
ncbi:hypothetical protein RR48_04588 [Papilio machaon]|uniref:Uncharacterized protein n=1 Tax=Papilio machaon TaxID=76193 RepID=A0A0N1PHA2_PAPMA|nr:hypothetical protein RR48_04588 [Papilio machaon]